ncbi:flagellar hook-basal body complex protein [uncultured Clostridium sp.]|uniref:flagellar hook-basal body complex protein n=1 Tax=uncultured Clostridium sp. TaxID=59620 RepID=UPI0032172B1E
MIRGLYTVASGIITSEKNQSAIMNNLANINTTGYKSQILSMKSFDEVYISNKDGKDNKRVTIGSMSNGVEINDRTTNFSQGSIKDTGLKTDFALQGEGFFVVQRQTANGTTNYYTRDGHFAVDTSGYLVTSNGDRVLSRGENGLAPIYIDQGSISADNAGNISVDGRAAGTLAVVNFPKNNQGKYENLNEFTYNLFEGTNPTFVNNPYVVNKSLEGSNVSVVQETSNMMTVMRNFESNATILKVLDSTLDKAVNEIGSAR